MFSLLVIFGALAASHVVSAQTDQTPTTVPAAATACLADCNTRVIAAGHPAVPCGAQDQPCVCDPPTVVDEMFFCMLNSCPDFAIDTDNVVRTFCTSCDANSCILSQSGTDFFVNGPAAGIKLSTTAETPLQQGQAGADRPNQTTASPQSSGADASSLPGSPLTVSDGGSTDASTSSADGAAETNSAKTGDSSARALSAGRSGAWVAFAFALAALAY
ncbi:hypothetical protein EXIGLDRAFT_753686 [Exidia glandulosa HHB12029]|uniref:CFEM domain-containing protein n=1 Tax=Exidia glandulosa HHB12029 TaxID=1314781 RepID=A0A165DK22_EXIGL|nr:hypothetical protein EXIGLDRAFT_753686 [Exidia glandulosa HHB12029]